MLDLKEWRSRKQQSEDELEFSSDRLELCTSISTGSRTIYDCELQLENGIIEILNENHQYLPITARRIHYELLNTRPVCYKNGSKYSNDNSSYKKLLRVLTNLRFRQQIPFSWITDEQRIYENNRGWQSVNIYLDSVLPHLFNNFERDLLQSQPVHIAIICEKATLGPQIRKVAGDWDIPFAFIKGQSSSASRYLMLKDWQQNGEKDSIYFLVLTDLDPAGIRIPGYYNFKSYERV